MRKNVLIFGHDYTTQFVDIFNQYTRLFDKEKYVVTVAYLTGEPDEDVRKKTIAEEVVFLNIPKKEIRSLKIGAIKTLLKMTREKKFETVICHRYKPSYIMMLVAKFSKIPTLISVMHELRTMTSIKRRLLIAMCGKNNVIFAGVSNAVRDDLRKSLWFMPKERVVTLYNVIDVELTEPQFLPKDEARKALNISNEDFVFGNLGRLVKNKDQTTLIKAFAKIKSTCPKAKLAILGEGELEAELKKLVVTLDLQNDVIFTGFVVNGFRYMKAFDCFVLSSIQEAFGRVLIEAMLAKLPVIATRVNGVPEVMKDTGVLINPRDTDILAESMQKIYEANDKQREEIGNEAYQHVIQNYSIPAFQKQYTENTNTTHC